MVHFTNIQKTAHYILHHERNFPWSKVIEIKKTMRHLALKGEVCCRRSFFGCSRNNPILKDGVCVKFLDIIMTTKNMRKKGSKLEIETPEYYVLCRIENKVLWVINAKNKT